VNNKHGIDAVSIAVMLATIVDWLPAVAAVLSIIWTLLRIIEILCNWEWISCKKDKK
jgi:hypothetical protein